MDKLAVGQIGYVNSYPLFYTIITDGDSLPFDVVTGVPAVLNRMMRGGELDVSLISSYEYTQAQDRYYIHRDFCLASVGYVNSVLLVSNKEIEDLNGAVIGLSPASGTSSNLIRIILKEFYHCANEFCLVKDPADCRGSLKAHDAVLMIGDDALRFGGIELPDHAQALQAAQTVGQRALTGFQTFDKVNQFAVDMFARIGREEHGFGAAAIFLSALVQE